MAFWSVGGFLYFWIIDLFPRGRIATFLAAAKQEYPERFRYLFWKRASGLRRMLIMTPYLILLVFAPERLTERRPMWPGLPLAVALLNTFLFIVLTQLLLAIAWLPGWGLRALERRT
jgi:hypothetical protein